MQRQSSRHAAFSLFSSYHLHTVLEFTSLLRATPNALDVPPQLFLHVVSLSRNTCGGGVSLTNLFQAISTLTL